MCTAESEAVSFFQDLISKCNFSTSFAFIQIHIQNSPPNVQQLMDEKYSGDNLYDFFEQHSDVFNISKLGVISLNSSTANGASFQQNKTNTSQLHFERKQRDINIETKIASYYEDIIKNFYNGGTIHVSSLYDPIEQASADIITYLNQMYPGDTFELFFYRFPDIFHVSKTMNVSLKIKKIPLEQNMDKDAVEFFRDILSDRYSEPVNHKYLQGHLSQAEDGIRNFMRKKYPGQLFCSFFANNQDAFQVDDLGNVSLRKQDIEEKAVEYFQSVLLNRYTDPAPYKSLRGHLGQASDNIRDFMSKQYPVEDFLSFFKDNEEIFQVDPLGNVSLQSTERKAVTYFQRILLNRYTDYTAPYTSLHGHLGQASDEIIDFMSEEYPAEDFLSFFENNKDTFQVDSVGNVSLESTERKAVTYFQRILLNRYTDPVPYTSLHGHLGQASDEVIDFMSEEYPVEDFRSFFENNKDIFQINWLGYVSLR